MDLKEFEGIEQYEMVELGKKFFFYFAIVILNYQLLNEDNLQWCMKFQQHVEEWEKAKAIGKEIQYNSLWLEPRETFKSTVLTIAGAIWLIIRNPNISIIIASKIADNSQKFLREIKQHFEKNILLIKLYGNQVNRKDAWTQSQIIVASRNKLGIKEPTIQAVGSTTALTSVHYDVGIFDDLVDGKDRESAAERKTIKNFNTDLSNIIKRNGFRQYVGTRWHPNDLYNDIITDIIPHSNTKHSIWEVDIQSCYNEDGSARFKVLTLDQLAQKKVDMGSVLFAANFENRPLSGETQLFSEDGMTYFDMEEIDVSRGQEIIGYCDPALGKTKQACFAPIVSGLIVREDEKGNALSRPIIYLFDMDVKKRTTTVIKNTVANKQQQYEYHRFGMEGNAFQSELVDSTEEFITGISDINNLLVEPIQNKINKDVRIESLEIPISRGEIRFRSDWRTAPNNYREGMEQLFWYPIHPFKDVPDALEALWKMVNVSAGVLV